MHEDLIERLLKHVRFLETEISDYHCFVDLTQREYLSDRHKRRNVERWAENIINSSIDIAQIVIVLESVAIPDSYRETVKLLGSVEGLGLKDPSLLSEWVRFRNILAHEYIDIRWRSLDRFIRQTQSVYQDLVYKVKDYLRKKIADLNPPASEDSE